ncbi:hypothetical protein CTAYLR_001611 [Chrysophaeum taylorii]|uniref:PH domain-containing protein n=1 Tax=Chrysophaeum taylorii TaxID=2483200 RepID=A0AAD7XNA6_9STRA|nr:hypothetical protein CTAYLR_001611 [Chrysophaeum taylorii]
MFELQLQGKFTQKPPGPLFVGGELESPQMKLSGLVRLAARGTLAFVRAVAGGGLSYSFGDPETGELPHITAPLFSSMPMVYVGDDAVLGTPLHALETVAERSERRSRPRSTEVKACRGGETVTFSLNSAVVDARAWSARLPGLPPLDLHRLWDDAALVVTAYALVDPPSHAKKKYLLRIRLRHFYEDEEEEEEYYDARNTLSSEITTIAPPFFLPDDDDETGVVNCVPRLLSWANNVDAALLGAGARGPARCDGWVSVVDSFDRIRRDYFVVIFEGNVFLRRRKGKPLASTAAALRFRKDGTGTSRLSLNEKRRRRVDATVSGALDPATWLGSPSSADSHFLQASKFFLPKKKKNNNNTSSTTFAGPVARCSSRRSWREEWAELGRAQAEWTLAFYEGTAERYRVTLADAVEVRETTSMFDVADASRFGTFEVSTMDRACVVAAPRADVGKWLEALHEARKLGRLELEAARAWEMDDDLIYDDKRGSGIDERLMTPGDEWSGNRFVLNARNPFPPSPDNSRALCERLAIRADRLQWHDEEWAEFHDDSAKLRDCDATAIDLASWLNIYHALAAHAALVVGLPTTPFSFVRHHTTLCWEIGGDVASLAELEHLVVRAAMPRPRLLVDDLVRLGVRNAAALLRFSTTTTRRPSRYIFALDVVDPRLVFAINPATTSSPATVPLYYDEADDQLDDARDDYLALSKLSADGRHLFLPRVCAWHDLDLDRDVFPYLPTYDPSSPPPAKVSYLDFHFTSRHLRLVRPPDIDDDLLHFSERGLTRKSL